MMERRSILAMLATAIGAVAAPFHRRRTPRFEERTPPGNRFRKLSVRGRPLYVREDLFRSGLFDDVRFHDEKDG